MTEQPIKTILAGTDFNPLAVAALRLAARLAARAGARLIVVYADTFEPPAEFTASQVPSIAGSIERSRRKTAEELERHVAKYAGDAGVAWQSVVVEDFPADAIAKAAVEHGADLIALGTHGRGGLQRLMLGSVAEAVIREAHVPVLTVRSAETQKEVQRIVCTAGGREVAERIARAIGAELTVLDDVSPESLVQTLEAGAYDLVVTGREPKLLTRHARIPVVTVRARAEDHERRTA